jgi:hypothetical protein
VEETATVVLRDFDVVFGFGQMHPLTLEQADSIQLPERLAAVISA